MLDWLGHARSGCVVVQWLMRCTGLEVTKCLGRLRLAGLVAKQLFYLHGVVNLLECYDLHDFRHRLFHLVYLVVRLEGHVHHEGWAVHVPFD